MIENGIIQIARSRTVSSLMPCAGARTQEIKIARTKPAAIRIPYHLMSKPNIVNATGSGALIKLTSLICFSEGLQFKNQTVRQSRPPRTALSCPGLHFRACHQKAARLLNHLNHNTARPFLRYEKPSLHPTAHNSPRLRKIHCPAIRLLRIRLSHLLPFWLHKSIRHPP